RQLGRRLGSARRMAPGRRARLRPRILRGPEDAEGGPLPRDGVVVRTHPGPRRRLGHPAVTRLDETARGVFPISATPFSPDGALDLESLDRLVDFYLARRVHGLTLLGITGEALTVEAFQRMVDAFPRLVMLKHEDCPGLTKLGRIRAEAARTGRRRVSVLVGNNAIYYPQELARGADGAMTGFSYPEMLVE